MLPLKNETVLFLLLWQQQREKQSQWMRKAVIVRVEQRDAVLGMDLQGGTPTFIRCFHRDLERMRQKGAPLMVKEGERFFCNENLAMEWRKSLPYSDKAYPRIVFVPLSRWKEIGTPDLVFVFANPDQISALVAMQGFHNGKAMNTIAPFGAACHSILYAAEQMDKAEPYAVMGLFDISQRNVTLKNYLSMTMPYELWGKMTVDLDKSCLTTHSWRNIEKRLS